MYTWFQSPFLQSLGFAIANSLWQTGLLWLLYVLVSHVFRLSSTARYRFAAGVQLLSFGWFAVTIQFYYAQYSHSVQPAAGSVQAVLAGDGGTASQMIRYMVRAEQALPYVSVAYLLLIVVLGVRWLNGFRYTKKIRVEGLHKMPVDWRLFVQKVAPQLGIRKEIALYLSDKIQSPLTIGFWKPVILVPLASINHLTTAQMEAVLLHEMAHIRRYDYLVNILLSIVEISLFFNPFTQLIGKSIHKERENCCDDWVLQFQYSAVDYAQALLRIATLQTATPQLAMAATGGRKNELLTRVKRMAGQPEASFNYRKQLLSLLLVTGMLGCMAWFNPAKNTAATTGVPGKKVQHVAIEPMAVKVDNPLFNPVFFLSAPLKTEMQKNISAAQLEIKDLATSGAPEMLAQTIPPLIASALQGASFALEQQRHVLPSQAAGLDAAAKELDKLAADTASVLAPLRKEMGAGFRKTIQDINSGLNHAQKEIGVALDRKNIRIPFDEEKVRKDIRAAINEVSKLDLGLIINTALSTETTTETSPKQKNRRTTQPAAPAQEPVIRKKADAAAKTGDTDWLLPVSLNEPGGDILIKTVQPVFTKQDIDQLKKLALLGIALSLQHTDNVELKQQLQISLAAFEKRISANVAALKTCSSTDAETKLQ